MTMNYLTTKQAAILLALTPQAIRKAILRGKIKATKMGRDWIIERAEVERYRGARWTRESES